MFWRTVAAVIWREWRAEARGKERVVSFLLFSLLLLVVFSFAFDSARTDLTPVFPGILWIAYFFAGSLALNRLFLAERLHDAMHGLMLAPADRSAVYFGKAGAVLLFMLAVEALLTPLFFIFLDEAAPLAPARFVLVLLAASWGFAAVGTFLAAVAANVRAGELLLPLLLFPLLTPVILAAVRLTADALAGAPGGGWDGPWFGLLVVYDLVFVALPLLLFEYILEV